jgi:hypothetical protein
VKRALVQILALFVFGESRNPQGGQHSHQVWAQQNPQEEVVNKPAGSSGNGTSRSSPLAGFSLTKWCEEKGRPGGQPPGPLEERSRRSLHRDPLSLLRESRRPRLNTAVSHPAGPLTSGRIYPTGRHCHREKPRTGPGGKPQESRRVPRGILLPVRVPSPWSAAPPDSRSREGQSA